LRLELDDGSHSTAPTNSQEHIFLTKILERDGIGCMIARPFFKCIEFVDAFIENFIGKVKVSAKTNPFVFNALTGSLPFDIRLPDRLGRSARSSVFLTSHEMTLQTGVRKYSMQFRLSIDPIMVTRIG
jgi:hypothetical protein